MALHRRKLAPLGALVSTLAALGCGGGAGGGGAAQAAGGSSGGGSPGGSAHGTLTLSVVPPAGTAAGYTALAGKLYDGAYPETVSWTKVASAGGCSLSTPSTPLCTPACGSGEACVATDTCRAYPSTISAGVLTITGVGSSPLGVTPRSGSYSSSTTEYPPFAEGAAVRISAPGAASGSAPFTLGARGIAPLAVTATAAHIAKAGAGYGPLDLGWTAPGDGTVARVFVRVDLSHHGGARGKIECEAADTGSLSIPASLVTGLVGLGIYAYPKVEVTRRSTGTAAVGAGTVTLQIDSPQSRPITIEGLTCTASGDCASGVCELDPSSLRFGLCQ